MRRTFGTSALAAGLFALLTPATARAQFSHGYDSYIYDVPPSNTAYYNSGYAPVYTDPSLGVYRAGTEVPTHGAAPYQEPPYGQIGRPDVLGGRSAAVTPMRASQMLATPVRTQAQARRGLFGRVRGRR